VHATTARTYPVIAVDGAGVVSHAGTALLSEVADRVGLTAAVSEALHGLRSRRSGHDPGRVIIDVAVAIGDGAETISDVQALADQPEVHGPVASTATIWRVLERIDAGLLGGLRGARALARERAWAARGELTGTELPPARAAGRDLPYAVIDLDATLVTAHSEKEGTAGTFKGGWGYHPLLAFLDNTNEALAGILRPGKAASNTAADHITVLELALALAQLPDAHRHKPVLVRVDGAGFSHPLINYLAEAGLGYSVGFPTTAAVRDAIAALPVHVWRPAVTADGGLREGADVAEITGLLTLGGWPAGMRVLVRRERPHPGAQLNVLEERDGYRYQAICTNTGRGPIPFLEARHRAHARVEDRIRCGKDTGIGRFPSRHMPINAAWLEAALTATDLLAWTQTMLLSGELARAEPKKIRYRLLHTAPADNDASTCDWPATGPGHSPWPRRSPGSGSPRSRTEHPAAHHPDPPGDTGHRAGTSPCPRQEPPRTNPRPRSSSQDHRLTE